MAVTEAFTISNIDESEIGYVDIDRTYKYGGLMILDDSAFPDTAGIEGCTYFEEFDEVICKWCKNLKIDNQTIKLKVNWNVCKDINTSILNDKKNVVFNIDIKDGKIIKAYCDDLEIKTESWTNLCIKEGDYEVGVFGLIFDYYTKLISNNIERYEQYEDVEDVDIWGIYYH